MKRKAIDDTARLSIVPSLSLWPRFLPPDFTTSLRYAQSGFARALSVLSPLLFTAAAAALLFAHLFMARAPPPYRISASIGSGTFFHSND